MSLVMMCADLGACMLAVCLVRPSLFRFELLQRSPATTEGFWYCLVQLLGEIFKVLLHRVSSPAGLNLTKRAAGAASKALSFGDSHFFF